MEFIYFLSFWGLLALAGIIWMAIDIFGKHYQTTEP